MQTYLLVAQNEPKIEVFARLENWQPRLPSAGDTITLTDLGVTLALDARYETS